MLDNNAIAILNYINSKCVNENFVVLTNSEIVLATSNASNINESEVKDVISSLFSKGYIRLKYDDGTTFCVSSTQKGLNYKAENENEKNVENFNYNALVGWCFFASFIGGFASVLIALILSKFLGA